MLLHGKIESSNCNGPGERCLIYFQGCNLACSGCWNPDTHAFDTSKRTSYEEITNWLESLPESLNGLTFSGGDPLQHFLDTLMICQWVLKNRPNWTIGMYTGYSYKEAKEGRWKYFHDTGNVIKLELAGPNIDGSAEDWNDLECLLDFAIMGRYNKLLPANLPLRTTSNQELKLFSNRYTEEDFSPQTVEITIDSEGLTLTGFPVGCDLKELTA